MGDIVADLPFEPINRIHSLAELVLAIEFSAPIPPKTLAKANGLRTELSSILPKVDELQSMTLQVVGGSLPISRVGEGGFQLSSYKRDGSVEAVVRVVENLVSIHWLDYDRWEGARKFLQKVLDAALGRIRGGELFGNSIGLKFIDQFICADEDKYDLTKLIRRETDEVAAHAFDAGSRWHCHTGRYVGQLGGIDLLSQLNIDSTRQPGRVFINIDHTLQLRSTLPEDLNPYLKYSGTGAEWTNVLNDMHVRNKSLLAEILAPDVQKRIGLNGNE